ncbi:MAG: hypothetical protein QOI36_2587 [Pseudonocardiales bacterium]|jgi:hypothetical protein|nr:hypothetical protein [Pseudonocardia sp.]MDT7651181.1 hypothetical protein [Pseudonocardiales bacterium]
MGDIAEFHRAYLPFDELESAELVTLAAVAEPETHGAGAAILAQGAGPPEHVRMIRTARRLR